MTLFATAVRHSAINSILFLYGKLPKARTTLLRMPGTGENILHVACRAQHAHTGIVQ